MEKLTGQGEGVLVVYNNRVKVTQVFPPTMLDCDEFVITDVSFDREKCKATFVCFYLSHNAATKVENVKQVCKM